MNSESYTQQITADLAFFDPEMGGDTEEVIITSSKKIGERTATDIIRILFPNRHINEIKIETIDG